MKIIDRGSGTPVVVIPGIQGRWEWMKPAIDVLAQRCRVITFSLADEPSCGGRFEKSCSFKRYVEQVREVLDTVEVREAAICGVSYGGLIAAAFAARYPDRTSSLVLVSALSPSWKPDARVRFCLHAPRLLTPFFLLTSLRMYREIAAASAGVVRAFRTVTCLIWCFVTHMFSPGRMARRLRLLEALDLQQELARVTKPTLIVTGEPALDRVVPVGTTREYLYLWPQASVATIPRTGHLGLITRPDEFARLVVPFTERAAHGVNTRKRAS